jgi:hypothetical protein
LVKGGFFKRDITSLYYISFIDGISLEEMVESCISDFYPIDSLSLKNIFLEPYISQDCIRTRIHNKFTNISVGDLEKKITGQLGYSSNSSTLSFGVSGLILGLIGMETQTKRILNEIMSVI